VSVALRVDILLAKAYDPDPRVQREAHALARAGYRPRVLAWDRTGTRAQREMDDTVPIRRIRVLSTASRGWTQTFFLFRVALEYLRLMRRDPPDVLHAVDLPMLGVAIVLAPLLPGRRPAIVYDAFEIHALMGVHRYPAWLVWAIRQVERLLPRLADLVITPGEDRRLYFAERGIDSVAVPNWIDPPRAAVGRDDARRSLGVADGQFCIAYAGGIIGSRDLTPLLEHARRHPDDLVLIAGGGDAVPALREAAAGLDNVRLLGWISDTAELMAAADALYYALRPDHPYAAHAAPNNLYVAIAHAVPLIYREQGELALIGRQHRIGLSFEDDVSLDRAFDSLRDLDGNEAIREELRQLQGTYRWSRAADRLLAVYPSPERVAPARILLLTRIWPTRERPSVGSFIQARTAEIAGISVVRPRRDQMARPLLYLLLLWDALWRRGRFDGVEAHMVVPTGLVGLITARLRGLPVVVYSHGSDARGYRGYPWVIRWLARIVARRADRVVTNSSDTAAHLRALGAEPLIIPPGIDLSRFRPTARPRTRRVLYLGGRIDQKGYAVARRLADTLVGPGLREVAPDQVSGLMADHDIVLVPSVEEAFGLVAVEAIASGRWVVASAVGGLRDIVVDGVNGSLVTDGDFAAAIGRVPDYDPFAIARTVERFSLERWQRDMELLWATLLEGRRRLRAAASTQVTAGGARKGHGAAREIGPSLAAGAGTMASSSTSAFQGRQSRDATSHDGGGDGHDHPVGNGRAGRRRRAGTDGGGTGR
jgi:glycosyltransferase involved in cell wall biosynthesis